LLLVNCLNSIITGLPDGSSTFLNHLLQKPGIKRNFKINEKEYNSLEEMPADIREAFKKAMVSQSTSGSQIKFDNTTKIVFNGKEYESIDAMPNDIHQLYEKVLKSAETGKSPSEVDLTEISKTIFKSTNSSDADHLGGLKRSVYFKPSAFSLKRLIVSIILVAFIVVLYFLFKNL
jgi:hypothetical protein